MEWILWKNVNSNRYLHTSTIKREKDVSVHEAPEGGSEANDMNAIPLRKFDKRILVWSGKYKRLEDVPDRTSRAVLSKAQSVCRIKTCNYMMIATILGAIIFIMNGKRNAEKGISVSKTIQDWHNEYNKKFEDQEKK